MSHRRLRGLVPESDENVVDLGFLRPFVKTRVAIFPRAICLARRRRVEDPGFVPAGLHRQLVGRLVPLKHIRRFLGVQQNYG